MSQWSSPAPTKCELCEKAIDNKFVDGRIRGNGWACMCEACHSTLGVGLGTGRGQLYEKIEDKWKKVDG